MFPFACSNFYWYKGVGFEFHTKYKISRYELRQIWYDILVNCNRVDTRWQ